MYDNTIHRDYVKSELEYRLDRIRDEFTGRRRRKQLRRRDDGEAGWTTVR
ncbi:hypothetical protein [Nocardioides sp. URHA0032]|jgi:hypothetical protein|nr:hypothetical protein [Nocardioides sp. URHA0032]